MADETKAVPAIDPKAVHVTHTWKHSSPFLSCRFDPTGKYVFAGAQDNTVQRFEVATGKRTAMARHDSWVRALGCSPNGSVVFSGGSDGRLIWWPATDPSPQPVRIVEAAHAGWIRGLSVSPDGRMIATCGHDNAVKLWNAADGALLRTLTGHEGHVYSVLFHPSGSTLYSGDLLGKIKQWEAATGKVVGEFDASGLHTYHGGQQAHYGGVRSLSLTADQKQLTASGLHKATNPFGAVQEPLVLRFDCASHKLAVTHTAGIKRGIAWRAVAHPGGMLIGISGGADGGFLVFWQHDKPEPVHKWKMPQTGYDIDLHPDGQSVATAHYDKVIRVTRLVPKQA